MVRPPGIEPGLRVPETLVISFSLRARAVFVADGCRSDKVGEERENGGKAERETGGHGE